MEGNNLQLRQMSSFQRIQQGVKHKNTNLGISCCSLIFIIVITIILTENDGDCDSPVRLWLTVYLGALAGQTLFLLATQLIIIASDSDCHQLVKLQAMVNAIFGLFFIAWFITGNVWYFDIDSCDDFEPGYTLMLVLLILMYVSFGLCCFVCCCACCMGIIAAKSKLKQEGDVQNIIEAMERARLQAEQMMAAGQAAEGERVTLEQTHLVDENKDAAKV